MVGQELFHGQKVSTFQLGFAITSLAPAECFKRVLAGTELRVMMYFQPVLPVHAMPSPQLGWELVWLELVLRDNNYTWPARQLLMVPKPGVHQYVPPEGTPEQYVHLSQAEVPERRQAGIGAASPRLLDLPSRCPHTNEGYILGGR